VLEYNTDLLLADVLQDTPLAGGIQCTAPDSCDAEVQTEEKERADAVEQAVSSEASAPKEGDAGGRRTVGCDEVLLSTHRLEELLRGAADKASQKAAAMAATASAAKTAEVFKEKIEEAQERSRALDKEVETLRAYKRSNEMYRNRWEQQREKVEKQEKEIFELEMELSKYIDLGGSSEYSSEDNEYPTDDRDICKFFMTGHCKYGDVCRFRHPDDEEPFAHKGLQNARSSKAGRGSEVNEGMEHANGGGGEDDGEGDGTISECWADNPFLETTPPDRQFPPTSPTCTLQ